MQKKIVECVPNFSEGRDTAKIKQITDSIESVSGIKLLDVDPGFDTNRTVVTFIGSPEDVLEAAFKGIEKASQIIDMSSHTGAHPRMGAADVVPFIPVEGVDMQDCVMLAKKLGELVGTKLNIPVYLYEEAATTPQRKNLAEVRKGEYEGLDEKIKTPSWKPDFGPDEFNRRSGATIIGAREFLIAYNLNLNSTQKNHATDIAFALRQKGRVARTGNTKPYYNKGEILTYKDSMYPCGSCEFIAKNQDEIFEHCQEQHNYDLSELLKENNVDSTDLVGKKVYVPGKFQNCKAIGWYVDDYKRAQISINLTNYKVTPPHAVYDYAQHLAQERGLVVTGSEVVGLIPFNALLESGKHYLRKQGSCEGIPVGDILNAASFSLGLSNVAPFDIEKKVLGLPSFKNSILASMPVHSFIDEVSRGTPAPGGGSIAALAGSLGAALASMVANLTHGKPGSEEKDKELNEIAVNAQKIKDLLARNIDEDTNAFNAYMEARRLPNNTLEEQDLRLAKMEEGLKIAVDVPWQTAFLSSQAINLALNVAKLGNVNSITDAGVGAQVAYAGVKGGVWNVLINLKDIEDKNYVSHMKEKCGELLDTSKKLYDETNSLIDDKLMEFLNK